MPQPLVRPLRPDEIATLLQLCLEHAAYEKAAFSCTDGGEALRAAVFAEHPRLWCFVAEMDGTAIGYATCTRDYSTWRGADYLHLDCLYLTAAFRGRGIGAAMLQFVAEHARSLGCRHVEWQTPSWNQNAIRFYERLGATPKEKVRFHWRLDE